jgi:16S rRNA (guanine(966)-N(2))-methyltransferase RsmD
MADAGRVIAGSAKGVRLEAPGPGTRPLADRVKQTLFAILEPDLAGARVLDLFAGSGAAGIEALSRGAETATFVEHDGAAVRTITANLQAARLLGRATVIRADANRWLAEIAAPVSFDLVIVDPPYASVDLVTRALTVLGGDASPVVAGGRVVAKHFWRGRPPDRIGMLAAERDRRFGETALTFYRRLDADGGSMPSDVPEGSR